MAFGRIDRTPAGPRPFSDINVTPLVDVMLVLVVIFLLTAPLLASSIRLDLPRAEGTATGTAPPSLAVSIDRAGQVFVQGEAVEADALAERLAQAAQERPGTEIQLRADAAVPYGRVVEVMGLAHAAGLTRIGFVAEPRTPR
ncbi:biopolymer transporter ExbD [Acidovorax sp. Leaf160]|uniref:ExbD/TolR family protein n=1 Tax=Acidovorax sp. Leaf160 TaxID=1736280 RepID=UPI0006F365E8|nr:biopolymer transporter ExbD [Acidovorax sp. Leaf160]KQR42975.1 biopolymer transporter ExbD [Acidovorax sp. Leaf160]